MADSVDAGSDSDGGYDSDATVIIRRSARLEIESEDEYGDEDEYSESDGDDESGSGSWYDEEEDDDDVAAHGEGAGMTESEAGSVAVKKTADNTESERPDELKYEVRLLVTKKVPPSSSAVEAYARYLNQTHLDFCDTDSDSESDSESDSNSDNPRPGKMPAKSHSIANLATEARINIPPPICKNTNPRVQARLPPRSKPEAVIDENTEYICLPTAPGVKIPIIEGKKPRWTCDGCQRGPLNVPEPFPCFYCHFLIYCLPECRKGDWRAHEKRCDGYRRRFGLPPLKLFRDPNRIKSNPNALSRRRMLLRHFSPMKSVDQGIKPEHVCLKIARNEWLEGRTQTDVFKLLTDAFRLRLEDTFRLAGVRTHLSLYDDAFPSSIWPFRRYLVAARERHVVPGWWTKGKQYKCEEFAMDPKNWHNLFNTLSRADVMRKYGDDDGFFAWQLRECATMVYGCEVGEDITDNFERSKGTDEEEKCREEHEQLLRMREKWEKRWDRAEWWNERGFGIVKDEDDDWETEEEGDDEEGDGDGEDEAEKNESEKMDSRPEGSKVFDHDEQEVDMVAAVRRLREMAERQGMQME